MRFCKNCGDELKSRVTIKPGGEVSKSSEYCPSCRQVCLTNQSRASKRVGQAIRNGLPGINT